MKCNSNKKVILKIKKVFRTEIMKSIIVILGLLAIVSCGEY